MGKNSLLKKVAVVAIITVFFTTSLLPTISGINIETNEKQNIITQKPEDVKKKVTVTCYNFGMPGQPSKEIEIPQHEAEYLYEKIKELNFAVAIDPLSERTQQLQIEIVDLADEYDLLPTGLSKNQVKKQYLQVYKPQTNRIGFLPQTQSKASEFLCTFVSTGSGGVLPIIALPRFIPFLMIPIPRLLMIWRAQEAVTSCGGLRSGTGFIAYGQQNGIALGFWGLGFTFSLPPLMGVYGLAGYSLYATVDAEYIDFYPPNSPPVISLIDPSDGEINVPLSLSELRFQISDLNGDLMSYTVTTSPDIGSGSGNLKPDGLYSVPISGLEDLTEYSWHVEVTDGMDTTSDDYFFTTEAVAPIVSNPSPQDGERYVPLSLSYLSFHLKDFQSDLMDYTVETVPDIGSGSGSGVGEGTYSVPVSGLDYSLEYIWYVNVTDGEHESRKVFSFQSELEMIFDPFNSGWMYRKMITIDHNLIDSDLENFPVLISTTDIDLHDKAQDDGDDILFMDGVGVANRLFHEIELFDSESGEMIAWVNVANLDDDQDTILYIYYGNSESDCQQAPELVWDSKYKGVWHLKENPGLAETGDIKDSTFNKNHATDLGLMTSSDHVFGKIGYAIDFDGDDDQIETISNIPITGSHPRTLSCWVNVNSVTQPEIDYQIFALYGSSADYQTFGFGLTQGTPSGTYDKYSFYGWGEGDFPSGMQFVPHIWYYCTVTFDGTTIKLYINGDVGITAELPLNTGSAHLFFGSNRGSTQHDYFLLGMLDEVRISDTEQSSAWISASYDNQNDPLSFLSFGPEVPAP